MLKRDRYKKGAAAECVIATPDPLTVVIWRITMKEYYSKVRILLFFFGLAVSFGELGLYYIYMPFFYLLDKTLVKIRWNLFPRLKLEIYVHEIWYKFYDNINDILNKV